MSNISNRHQVSAFVSGTSKPLSGQRLCKVGYKNTDKTPAKYPSVCVSLPPVTAEVLTPEALQMLTPHILAMIEQAQDGVVRSLYEGSDGTLTAVGDDDISVAACCAYLSAVAAGGRLTGELVGAWFDAQVAENLTVVIAQKLGFEDLTDAQMVQIRKHLAGYKSLVVDAAQWTDKKARLTPQQINGVRRAIEIASVDDDISRKLEAKIKVMEAKPDMAALLEL